MTLHLTPSDFLFSKLAYAGLDDTDFIDRIIAAVLRKRPELTSAEAKLIVHALTSKEALPQLLEANTIEVDEIADDGAVLSEPEFIIDLMVGIALGSIDAARTDLRLQQVTTPHKTKLVNTVVAIGQIPMGGYQELDARVKPAATTQDPDVMEAIFPQVN